MDAGDALPSEVKSALLDEPDRQSKINRSKSNKANEDEPQTSDFVPLDVGVYVYGDDLTEIDPLIKFDMSLPNDDFAE